MTWNQIAVLACLCVWCGGPRVTSAQADNELLASKNAKQETLQLFDGKSLDGWKLTNFGGEGEVSVENGLIKMEPGYPLTGITYVRAVPMENYEIRLEAKRVDGNDFFCGLTFPVGKSHCSLILGGWGGTTTGLSSIDGADASQNGTTKYINYQQDKWYKVRLRVTDKAVRAWLDDKQIVEQPIDEVQFSTRIEVDRSKPLGICAFETRSWLRNLQLVKLTTK